jgi:hypothetical protein
MEAEKDSRLRVAYLVVFGEDADGLTRQVAYNDVGSSVDYLIQACEGGLKNVER